MEVKILFIIFLASLILLFLIIYRKHSLLKNLKKFAKKSRIEKEREILKEIEEKNTITKDDLKAKNCTTTHSFISPVIKQKIKKAEMLISYSEDLEAKKILTSILATNENLYDANFLLGKIALKKGHYEQAEVFLLKCLKQKHKNVNLLSNLGLCFLKQEKYSEAIESYEYISKLNLGDFKNYLNLGQAYFAIANFEKAKEALLKAVNLNPRNTEILFMLAELYIELKKLKGAKDFYRKILNIEPYNQEANNYLDILESKKSN